MPHCTEGLTQGDMRIEWDSLEKTEQPALRRVASTWIDEQEGVAGYPRRATLHGDMH